jgi:hypothetical protein
LADLFDVEAFDTRLHSLSCQQRAEHFKNIFQRIR